MNSIPKKLINLKLNNVDIEDLLEDDEDDWDTFLETIYS